MNKLADGVFSDEQIINLLTTKPADILGLSQKIDINKPANLTLFTLSGEGTFEKDQIECVSKNSPFLGAKQKGCVIGIINNNQIKLN